MDPYQGIIVVPFCLLYPHKVFQFVGSNLTTFYLRKLRSYYSLSKEVTNISVG